LNETRASATKPVRSRADIRPQYSRANLTALKRGAVMSMIMDLLFREYLKAKLAEMNALPAVPAAK
jgi:hypothetical protein